MRIHPSIIPGAILTLVSSASHLWAGNSIKLDRAGTLSFVSWLIGAGGRDEPIPTGPILIVALDNRAPLTALLLDADRLLWWFVPRHLIATNWFSTTCSTAPCAAPRRK